jgi:enterochelin esterase-like enzyme
VIGQLHYYEILIFDFMHNTKVSGILVENCFIPSRYLGRNVAVDLYVPARPFIFSEAHLLLINDGQNMEELGLPGMMEDLGVNDSLICVAIHAGTERKMEYGVAAQPDYMGRGSKAALYTSFIIDELLVYIHSTLKDIHFKQISFAGFSLGGLSALDIVWNHPAIFSKAGIFSGSFWWRSADQAAPDYDDDKHRIMHQQIRKGTYAPQLKFFFQCGNMDEIKDRNGNGIIDSVDDTLDIIKELTHKGYIPGKDIRYMEMPDGKHDIPTWKKAMPEFLKWLCA